MSEWHPVSICKLPAYDKRVFISCRAANSDHAWVQIGMRDRTNAEGEQWVGDDDDSTDLKETTIVIAWMELPEPYVPAGASDAP